MTLLSCQVDICPCAPKRGRTASAPPALSVLGRLLQDGPCVVSDQLSVAGKVQKCFGNSLGVAVLSPALCRQLSLPGARGGSGPWVTWA